jgi:hypothetical protein
MQLFLRIALGGEGESCRVFWCGNIRERDHGEDPDLDGKIIL